MRGADYIIKRTFFAIATVFVAITINFFLFRVLPGSAVTDLSRVPHASPQLKLALGHTRSMPREVGQGASHRACRSSHHRAEDHRPVAHFESIFAQKTSAFKETAPPSSGTTIGPP